MTDVSFYKRTLFPAVVKGAKSVGRDPDKITKILEVNVAYDEDYDKALQACKRWGTIMMPVFYKYPVSDPREVEATSVWLDEKQLAKVWIISSGSGRAHTTAGTVREGGIPRDPHL